MAGGTVYGTTSNEYIDAKVVWTATAQSSEDNYSLVRQKLYYKSNITGYSTHGTGTFTCHYQTYNSTSGRWEGAVSKYTKEITITSGSWVLAAECNHYAPHNDDGTGSLHIWWDGELPVTTLTWTEVDKSVTLDTIPRVSSIDSLSCATSYFTGAMTYQYTPKANNLYNRCDISLNLDGKFVAVKTINLGKKEALQQTATVTLSSSELSTVYNELPKTTKGKLRFTLITYSDSGYSNQIGEAGYKEITLTILNDDSTQPTVTMTLSPVSDFTGGGEIYVKGLSKVKAAFTGGAGKYGATIASYKMNVEAKDYGSPYTSAYLTATGSITVKGTVTDSRGYSRTYSQTISVIDYTTPTIDLVSCNTTYFTGSVSFKYTPANNVFYSRCVVALNISGTLTAVRTISLGVKSAGQKTETFTFTADEIDDIYNEYTSSTKGVLRFTYSTYSDENYSDEVGSATYKEITLSIPNDDTTKPTATLSVTPVSSLPSAFVGLYIKGKTKATANLANGAGKYGATIKSYTVTVGAQGGTPPFTSTFFTTAGDVTVTGTVTDSRGYSRTYSQTISVLDYSSPRLIPVSGESKVIITRCNAAGAIDENGTNLLIAVKRAYSKNIPKNLCEIQYRIKVEGGSYSSWATILAKTVTSDEIILRAVSGVALEISHTYVVQVRAVDDIGEIVTTTTYIGTQKVYMHRAGSINSFALGKYAETPNTFDVAQNITAIFRGNVLFMGEAWVELPLGTNVAKSTVNSGRCGTGVYYRVCAGGKHIYVAFNVSFTTSSSTVRAESSTISYPPSYDVYALCPVGFSDGSRGIATVSVSQNGVVNIYAVHKLQGATLSVGETVTWIDGYIDYWI